MKKDNDSVIPLLAAQLKYDPETGALSWRRRDSTSRVSSWWNTKYAEKPAGNINKRGYVHIGFKHNGKVYKLLGHRVAWYCHTGSMPEFNIDHVDGNPTNNIAINLRDIPNSINMRNTKHRSNNTSGITGVFWNKLVDKWEAVCKEAGVTHHLGKFTDKEDARLATTKFRASRGFTGRCYLEDPVCSGSSTQ